jgi:hypothetical protein
MYVCCAGVGPMVISLLSVTQLIRFVCTMMQVLIVGEVFGTANMGANYMFFDGLSSAFGTLILSKFVTQIVYEGHIESQGSRTCYGQQCFLYTHIVIAVLSFTCVLASYWFYRSTRHAYARRRDTPTSS